MNKIFLNAMLVLALVVTVSLPVGCGSGETTDEPAIEVNPTVGMTKAEIKAMYQGEPDTKNTNSDGTETWRYHMNAGEAWIPYNFGYQPEYHTINFDADGKVVSYSTVE